MYPETDALDLLQVLEALEVCTQCDNDGEIEYEFPCLNFVETLNGLWQKDPKRFATGVYGGVQIRTDSEYGGQLKHLFARIQVSLRRNVLQDNDDPDAELYQWHHGSKYCCGDLEGVLTMDQREQYLELKVRGPSDSRTALFYFLEDFINVIDQSVLSVCPGLCTERHTMSSIQLKEHSKFIHSYSPKELMKMQLAKKMCVRLTDDKTEDFADVVCMGSQEVVQNTCLGVDLPILHLSIHTRRQLSKFFDPPDSMGRDWCLLAVVLGLEHLLPVLDTKNDIVESRTDRVLEEWAKVSPQCTIGQLLAKFKELNRDDAIEMILQTGPSFKMVVYEDHSTDESQVPPPTTASTNTLSNLSR